MFMLEKRLPWKETCRINGFRIPTSQKNGFLILLFVNCNLESSKHSSQTETELYFNLCSFMKYREGLYADCGYTQSRLPWQSVARYVCGNIDVLFRLSHGGITFQNFLSHSTTSCITVHVEYMFKVFTTVAMKNAIFWDVAPVASCC
jgi:hypothetical protein